MFTLVAVNKGGNWFFPIAQIKACCAFALPKKHKVSGKLLIGGHFVDSLWSVFVYPPSYLCISNKTTKGLLKYSNTEAGKIAAERQLRSS
jgi:hypothetical protein